MKYLSGFFMLIAFSANAASGSREDDTLIYGGLLAILLIIIAFTTLPKIIKMKISEYKEKNTADSNGTYQNPMESIDLICYDCKHFIKSEGEVGCKAFPEGIPDEIIMGGNKHITPLPGQENDLTFSPAE